jgi:hypothetical protein
MRRPIIGQEAVCPDGLGRVVSFGEGCGGAKWIMVDTYYNNRGCKWDSKNVKLVKLILDED